MSESKISIQPLENGPNEVMLLRNQEQAIIARHSAKHDWFHLLDVIKAIQNAIAEDFQLAIDGQTLKTTIAYEPFSLTVSFWRKGNMLKKASIKQKPGANDRFDITMWDLVSRLPKLFHQLEKAHKKADTLMVAFEWLETVDSAPAAKVAEVIAKSMRDSDIR